MGFLASGVNCGVRRYRPDIGILISEVPAVVAGVFTLNECKAAPVTYTQQLLPADNILAILTNSGQANAATGAEGVEKNLMMVSATAKSLKCDINQVLVASTGVIGVQLDTDKILPSIPELVSRANDHAESFATAILTTDLVPKTVTDIVHLSGGTVRVTGISKGSGMIHPNMATMLGYILTDAKITKEYAAELIKKTADISFNMISVDGDSSTNDCCFLMANGAAGIELKTAEDKENFETVVQDIGIFLAKSIAADGEGATKLIEVVGIGKQLLMTRGALTTFSIANDVAKYFAIIPALFIAAIPELGLLNVMGLASSQSAILSAVIFNALILVALIPLALKGIAYTAQDAATVLRRNLLIYGLGGILVPFVGIKIIDMAITGLGLV
jgi:glutamate N-acetyltransferase/amino-acid N-acetyltransferase